MTYYTTEFLNRMVLQVIAWMGLKRLHRIDEAGIVYAFVACYAAVGCPQLLVPNLSDPCRFSLSGLARGQSSELLLIYLPGPVIFCIKYPDDDCQEYQTENGIHDQLFLR